MTLSHNDSTSISRADNNSVVAAISQLRDLKSLGPANPFSSGHVPSRATYTASEINGIKELIAFSGPNHFIDGWAFLARALSALLAGDMHSARHFAYYAELRGALSLLASGGVGIFDHKHFVLEPGNLTMLETSSGTHVAGWKALFSWVATPDATRLFSRGIPIGSSNIESYLQVLSPNAGGANPFVAGNLLSQWGMDLQRLLSDKADRNASSYRSQTLQQFPTSAADCVDFVASFWEAFEPSGPNRFELLDKQILRLAVRKQLAVLGHTALSPAAYNRLSEEMKTVVSLDFLNGTTAPQDNAILRHATRTNANASSFEMVARASLLLRAAGAAVRTNLTAAGWLTSQNLNSWMGDYSVARALIENSPIPDETSDLWLDVADAIDRLSELNENAKSEGNVLKRWSITTDNSSALPRASEAERVGLWSLSVL